ncbi:thioredoxin 2 [Thermoplasmatales archaeon]|nr:thioredoxin 2 [Thermoplasmatales archaeon]
MNSDDEIEKIRMKQMDDLMKSIRGEKNAASGSTGTPIDLNDRNFSAELMKQNIMVVDFWAPWCGPCQMVHPIIEELAREYAGKVTFGRLNVDDNQATSAAFRVRSIPTILIFKNGKVADGVIGAVPKKMLESKIKSVMSAQ